MQLDFDFSEEQTKIVHGLFLAFECGDIAVVPARDNSTGKVVPCIVVIFGDDEIVPIGTLFNPGEGSGANYTFPVPEDDDEEIGGVSFVSSDTVSKWQDQNAAEPPSFFTSLKRKLGFKGS